MADENVNIEVTGFQSLKGQIKEAQIEYQKLLTDVNSTPAAVNAAAAKVADLKDRFDDANDAVNALTGAGKFQAVTKSLTALSGGFTALQGAIGLAGGDAKDFEKTFQKVQSAMALTQGLTALEDLGNAFGNLKKVAVNAFQAIKGAIGATGIGLLVVALGTIYAYWDDIKAAVSGVSAEQEKLNKLAAADVAAQSKKLDDLGAQDNILKLQGKSEKDILKMKMLQTDEVIAATEVQLQNQEATKKAQVDAAKRNKDILEGTLKFLTAPLAILLKTVDSVGKALGKDFGLEEKLYGGIAKMVFDPKAVEEEGNKTIEETKKQLTKLKNDRAGFQLQINAIDKQDSDNKKAKAKTDADNAKKAQEEAYKAEVDASKIKNDKLITDARTAGKDTKDLEVNAKKELLAIQEEYDKKGVELTKEIADTKNAIANQQYDNQKAVDEKRKELAKQTAEALVNTELEKRDAEIKAEQEKFKVLIDQYAVGTAEREALEKQLAENIATITKTYSDKQVQILLDAQNAIIDNEKASYADRIAALDKADQAVKEATTLTEEEKTRILAENTQKRKDLIEEERQSNLDAINGILELATKAAEATQAIGDAVYAGKLKNVKKGSAEEEAILKKQFEFNKKMQLAAAVIDGAKAATASLAQSPVAIGPVPNPAGIASLAFVAITTAATIAKIAATQFEGGGGGGGEGSGGGGSKFAEGGFVSGPGSSTSDSIPARLSDGEFVVNAKSTERFRGLLENINAAGNGKSMGYAAGGWVGRDKRYREERQNIKGEFEFGLVSIADRLIKLEDKVNQPMKTYVVASDMTSQQEADAKIERIAQL